MWGALRLIARGHGEVGSEWRARWRASTKTGSPLFEGATTDWNINQVALVFWSNFYDNIYEHYERPSQKIIENDDLLDKWVEDKAKESEEKARKSGREYGKGAVPAMNYDEVIVFGDENDEDWEDEEEYEDEEVTEIWS